MNNWLYAMNNLNGFKKYQIITAQPLVTEKPLNITKLAIKIFCSA